MLVRVRQFILLVDFIVLYFDEDVKIPILLGRPFLATSRVIVDVSRGDLTIDIDGEVKVIKCVESDLNSKEKSLYSGYDY